MLRRSGACSGEAVQHKILQPQMVSELFLVVALSMAITPFLASLGQRLGKAFEKSDMSVRAFQHRRAHCLHRGAECMVSSTAACSSMAVLRSLALLQRSAGGLSPDAAVLCSTACLSSA